jgi:hypothetical protein
MLLRARSGSGERRKVALNELVVEALSLAYHGARARDPNLNLTPRAADDRRCADWSRNRGDEEQHAGCVLRDAGCVLGGSRA